MSVHDPEMRHGHKSSSRFDGHKAAIVVDTDSQRSPPWRYCRATLRTRTGGTERGQHRCAGGGGLGDAAYGDGATRQTFADADRKLVARVPGRPDRAQG